MTRWIILGIAEETETPAQLPWKQWKTGISLTMCVPCGLRILEGTHRIRTEANRRGFIAALEAARLCQK